MPIESFAACAAFSKRVEQNERYAGLGRHEAGRWRSGRNDQGHRPSALDCAGDPHTAVSALQHPIELNGADAFGGRLSVRLEIFLWL